MGQPAGAPAHIYMAHRGLGSGWRTDATAGQALVKETPSCSGYRRGECSLTRDLRYPVRRGKRYGQAATECFAWGQTCAEGIAVITV